MLELANSAFRFGKVVVSDASTFSQQYEDLVEHLQWFGVSVVYWEKKNKRPELKALGVPFDTKIVESLVQQINDEEEAEDRHLFDGWDEQAMERQS